MQSVAASAARVVCARTAKKLTSTRPATSTRLSSPSLHLQRAPFRQYSSSGRLGNGTTDIHCSSTLEVYFLQNSFLRLPVDESPRLYVGFESHNFIHLAECQVVVVTSGKGSFGKLVSFFREVHHLGHVAVSAR
jgi:hypothetical protein